MQELAQLQGFLFDLAPVVYDEYLLVIRPDITVSNDILYNQRKAAEILGIPLKNCSADIVITSFYADAAEAETIGNTIRTSIKGRVRASFIWLENYSCNSATGSILIKSKPAKYFHSIQQAIYPCLTISSALERSKKVNYVREPHIIISKPGKKKIGEVWDHFRDRAYENKIIADTLLLLKRNEMEGTNELVAEIKL